MQTRLFAAVFTAIALVACGGPEAELGTTPSEVDETGELSSKLATTVVDQQVTWRYVDMIGRSVEQDLQVPGSVRVTFVDGLLPLAGFTTQLQTAQLDVVMPVFGDASRNQRRRFFVRFETADGGRTLFLSSWGNSSIVDAALPNALGKFAATYDVSTQRARQTFHTGPRTSVSVLKLETQANGALKLTGNIGSPPEVRADHAWHTTSLTLQ